MIQINSVQLAKILSNPDKTYRIETKDRVIGRLSTFSVLRCSGVSISINILSISLGSLDADNRYRFTSHILFRVNDFVKSKPNTYTLIRLQNT